MHATAEFLDEVTRLTGINWQLAHALRIAEFELRCIRTGQKNTDHIIHTAQQALAQHDKESAT